MKELESLPEEWLSDLMGDHVVGLEREKSLSALLADPAAQRHWHLYHLAGDAMRSADLAPSPFELDFLERFEVRLASESVSYSESAVHLELEQMNAGADVSRDESANTGNFRWRAAPGALSLGACALVALVLWGATGGPQSLESTSTVSKVSPNVEIVASGAQTEQIMIRNPELDALLAAHGAMGGNSALQLPSGFLRNATFEQPAR